MRKISRASSKLPPVLDAKTPSLHNWFLRLLGVLSWIQGKKQLGVKQGAPFIPPKHV